MSSKGATYLYKLQSNKVYEHRRCGIFSVVHSKIFLTIGLHRKVHPNRKVPSFHTIPFNFFVLQISKVANT